MTKRKPATRYSIRQAIEWLMAVKNEAVARMAEGCIENRRIRANVIVRTENGRVDHDHNYLSATELGRLAGWIQGRLNVDDSLWEEARLAVLEKRNEQLRYEGMTSRAKDRKTKFEKRMRDAKLKKISKLDRNRGPFQQLIKRTVDSFQGQIPRPAYRSVMEKLGDFDDDKILVRNKDSLATHPYICKNKANETIVRYKCPGRKTEEVTAKQISVRLSRLNSKKK